jgi:hypothetical protein
MSITYSSVASRDSVCLAFLVVALNDLDVLAYDVGNTHVFECGLSRKRLLCCRFRGWISARDGREDYPSNIWFQIKRSGVASDVEFHAHGDGFRSAIADPYVNLQANAKPCGFTYYEYILVNVDDVLIVLHSPKIYLERIMASYKLNPNSIGPPTRYLGADVEWIIRPWDNTGQEYY